MDDKDLKIQMMRRDLYLAACCKTCYAADADDTKPPCAGCHGGSHYKWRGETNG